MPRKIGIIGSGLSAWAAFKTLDSVHKDCCEITVLDASIRESESSQVPTLAGKTKMGSSHMYAGDLPRVKFIEPSNFSLANGGLSTVWGAGIRLWNRENLEDYGSASKIYESARGLLADIPYSGTSASLNMPEAIEIKNTPRPPNSDDFVELLGGDSAKVCSFETSLALDVLSNKQCIGCGKCLSGCSYGSIFDSGNEFDKLITRQKVKVKKILVEKIVSGKDKLEVWGSSNKHEELVESFDEIHLCAGAIGTPLLLLKSNLLTEKEILVLDSQVFYFIGFRKFRKSSVPSFALSQVTLSSKERQDLNFKASIYRCNEDTRLRIKNLLKSKIFFNLPVPKILDNFLFLGIGFLDSDDSGKIMISKVADQLEVSPLQIETNGIRQVLALIRRYLLTFKFYVMPGVFMHPSPGLGFHSGGSLPVGSKIVDDFGRLRCDPRIRISDVSILKSIPAGPHTFSSMSIVSSIIKSEYENSNHGI